MDQLAPKEIVAELDKYIIGQSKAKRALALAIRDRLRRQRLPKEMADEIRPRNVLLIGSTGVGKTELARRLARLSQSPFIKVDASKFTEVGYVGRDVDSIIRDLTETAVEMVRQQRAEEIEKTAEENAENRLLAILTSKKRGKRKAGAAKSPRAGMLNSDQKQETIDRLRKDLREGKLNNRVVELEVQERLYESADFAVDEDAEIPLRELLTGIMGSRTFKKKMPVSEAIDYLISEEESRLIDMEQVTRESLDRVEQCGIVFIDELDKIAGRELGHGPDVSREGVQRDILPIVEGTAVSTRFGLVNTDQILFIAAGAFHVSRPSDLIPELQGRFPVRVEMDALTEEDFVQILEEPKNALIKQYQALLGTEGVELVFTREAIHAVARFAWLVNQTTEDIGARRLHTIMEALLEQISFEGSEAKEKKITIDAGYVEQQLSGIVKDSDLSRYIL